MLNKILQSKVPSEFKCALGEYWIHDESFLQSAAAYDGKAPSLACLIADVYARRLGKGFVPSQTKHLIDAYQSYIQHLLDLNVPTFVAAKAINVRYGATSALLDIGVGDAESHIAADMLMARRGVFNFPRVSMFHVASIDKAEVSKDKLPTLQFILVRDDYEIAVSMQSYFSGKKADKIVFNHYRNEGLIPKEANSVSVIEFLAYRAGEKDSSGAMYISSYFADGLAFGIPDGETEQMVKDAVLVAEAVEGGFLSELNTPSARAWATYNAVSSPSKRKILTGKLYGLRELVVV